MITPEICHRSTSTALFIVDSVSVKKIVGLGMRQKLQIKVTVIFTEWLVSE